MDDELRKIERESRLLTEQISSKQKENVQLQKDVENLQKMVRFTWCVSPVLPTQTGGPSRVAECARTRGSAYLLTSIYVDCKSQIGKSEDELKEISKVCINMLTLIAWGCLLGLSAKSWTKFPAACQMSIHTNSRPTEGWTAKS